MANDTFKALLVDYDEDLFAPPAWIGPGLAGHGITWQVEQRRTPNAVVEVARTSDVVLVQSVRPLLTRAVIQQLERCRCIVRLGIGYDSVDVEAATENGICISALHP